MLPSDFPNVNWRINNEIVQSSQDVIQEIQENKETDEDKISNKFVYKMTGKLSTHDLEGGFNIYGEKYKDSSTHSPETVTGADLAIAVGILTTEEKWGSGIILQAKSAEKHHTPPIQDLQIDSKKMLSYTPSSFVVIYDTDRFRTFPARAISGLNPSRFSGHDADEIHDRLDYMRLSNILGNLPSGFIGDNWVYENFESVLNPIEYPISTRGVAMDGGDEWINEPRVPAGLLILFVEKEYEKEFIDNEFPFEDVPFSSEGPLQGISKL